ERPSALIAMANHACVATQEADDDFGARATIEPIARGTDDSQNGLAIHGHPARGNIDVVHGTQPLDSRSVLVQPRLEPALAHFTQVRCHRRSPVALTFRGNLGS